MTDDLAERLDAAIGPAPASRPAHHHLEAGRRARRRRRVLTGAGLAVVLLATGGTTAALAVAGGDEATPVPVAQDPTYTPASTPTGSETPSETPTEEPAAGYQPGDDGDPDHVAWVEGTEERLVPLDDVTLLAQTADVPPLKDYAGPDDRTAAAKVIAPDGTTWFVLARESGGSPDYIPVRVSDETGAGLRSFLAFARERYESGEGLR